MGPQCDTHSIPAANSARLPIYRKTRFLCSSFNLFRKSKTSDFFEAKFRCLTSKVRMFTSKKSDVLHFRSYTRKKGCACLLHSFINPLKPASYIEHFTCCKGCRGVHMMLDKPTSSVFFFPYSTFLAQILCYFLLFPGKMRKEIASPSSVFKQKGKMVGKIPFQKDVSKKKESLKHAAMQV